MKKIIKFLVALGAASFVLGCIVSTVEKWKEKTNRWSKEKKHCFYGPYEKNLKRSLDFSLAFLLLICLSPVMMILALLIKIKLGTPVIFSQARPGKDEKIFKLYKFRTMTEERGMDGMLLSDEERLTCFGQKLRATSLDGRVIIGQTTESLENKGFREVSPIHFHKGHDLFSAIADHANIEGILCRSA